MAALSVWLAAATAGCAGHPLVRRTSRHAAYGAYLRGLMLERSSKLPDALSAYHEALEQDRQSPLLHVHLGSTYLKLGQMDRAMQSFERALAIDPNQPDALRWVAMLHASGGQLDKAVADYERLLGVSPNDQFIISTL
ncbi:MAG: tetratricopeptide repeat protein, partial [Candidatus Omnitrophica bacterium]|nr:tetratricopeptide repeat protein [Candidatus Omnitrophota bacterium]